MVRKKLDLGEYVVMVDYDKKTGMLDVKVLDENGDIIEGILITDDNQEESATDFDFNLN